MSTGNNFSFQTDLSRALRLDNSMAGPQMRWQRKLNESANTSRQQPLNSSNVLNASSSVTTAVTPSKQMAKGGISKTPKSSHKSKTPGKSPGKGHKTPGGDRFIANRANLNIDRSNYLISKTGSQESNLDLSPNTLEYQRRMKDGLQSELSDARILHYGTNAPAPPEGHQNHTKVLYSSSKDFSSAKRSAATRQISQMPERVLDAPEIVDDYYLNLLDWSGNNHLAVGLGPCVYIWNATSGETDCLLELEAPNEYISSLAWIKEGTILAVGTSSTEVQLWDVEEKKRMRNMTGHSGRVCSLAWNQYILSSGSRSGLIHHHDVRVAEHHVGTLNHHVQEVCGLAYSPDGRFLASGGNDNILAIWPSPLTSTDTANQVIYSFPDHIAAVKAIAWCPWQPSIVASGGGTADRCIKLFNCNTGQCINSVDTKSQVCSLLWSDTYKELVSAHGFAKNQLTVWKYPAMTKVVELHGHSSRILHMAMSPDGQTVASAGADETLRFWKIFAVDPARKKKETAASKTGSGMFGRKSAALR